MVNSAFTESHRDILLNEDTLHHSKKLSRDFLSENGTSRVNSSLELDSLSGFSLGQLQSVVLISNGRRADVRRNILHGRLIVYCVGSWCIVKDLPSDDAPDRRVLGADEELRTHHGLSLRTVETQPQKCRLSSCYRIYDGHSSKVIVITHSSTLGLCLSGQAMLNVLSTRR